MPAKKETTTTDEKLDAILHHLENLDRRDRMRTWGGFFRSMIALIPLILTLWGFWYLYNNWDTLLTDITKQAAEQAAQATQEGAEGFMQKFQLMFPQGDQQ